MKTYHSKWYFKLISLLMVVLFSTTTNAATLLIEPANPVVEIGQTITLSVLNAEGNIQWIAEQGQIEGEGTTITYQAPNETGVYAITVLDATSVGAITVTVCQDCFSSNTFLLENTVWEIFTQRTPSINAIALSPNKNTLWVNTVDGFEQWDTNTAQRLRVYATSDDLPDLPVPLLEKIQNASDNPWQNADSELLQFQAADGGLIFQADNAVLPDNAIQALLQDSEGGLWVKTNNSFIYRQPNGDWATIFSEPSELPADIQNAFNESSPIVFETDNLNLPSNNILSQLTDSHGTWLGTDQGLILINENNDIEIFNTDNSGLPHNTVTALESDQLGGLWIGTHHSLAHLTFGQKNSIINKITQDDPEKAESLRNALATEKRAAIFIYPQTQSDNHHQALAFDFITSYAYRNFQIRGYDNNEIYLLSQKPDLDFNGDARSDLNIVDAPVTLAQFRQGQQESRDLNLADIQAAFEWATDKGPLDYPLFVTFIGQSLNGPLLLNPINQETLDANTFKTLLDDYQNTTGNQLVVIIEASNSGTLIPTLAGDNRVIITSTGEGFAYYQDLGRTSFLKLFVDQLRKGDTLREAMNFVKRTFSNYTFPFNQQTPQSEDNANGNLAGKLCLNGCFGGLPGVLVLTVQPPGPVNFGQPIDFTVQTHLDDINGIHRVWGSAITPEVASQYQEFGYSLLPTPTIPFIPQPLVRSTRQNDNQWHGQFNAVNTDGEYLFIFKAIDNQGIITEAEPISVIIRSTSTYFDPTTNTLHIPAVTVGTEIYQANLILQQLEPDIILELDINSVELVTETLTEGALFDTNTGAVQIPLVTIGTDNFKASLQLIPETAPLQFRVESITLLQRERGEERGK